MKISSTVLKSGAITLSAAFLLLLTGAGAAHASGSISISNISPGTTVTIGSPVTFSVLATGFTNPTYTLTDNFVGGGLGSYDLNSLGNFSWTPESNDVGTHSVTIIVEDNDGDAATTNITFTVVAAGASTVSTPASSPTLSIQSLEPSSIVASGQTVSFAASTAGFSGTPTYTVSDSFSGTGSSLTNSDINSSGGFSWTPTANDAGTHTITVTGTDSTGATAQNSVSITVEAAAVSTVAPTTTVSAPTFTEDLTVGSSDDQVTALQNLLTAQGDFSGTATGYYGSQTEAAIEKFQAANNITQLGIVGPATRAALNALVTTPVAASTVVTTSAPTTSAAGPTINQIKSEVQSIETQITLIESQLSELVGQ